MTAPLRVAMVGLGWAARSIWLPRLHRQPDFRVTAAVDPAPSARAAATELGLDVPVHDDVTGLDPDAVDLAVVAVPNHLHARVGAQLLANRIPVFMEKPVCLDVAEADLLAAAERAGDAPLIAGSAGRYRADVLALYDLLPTVGRIRHVDLSWVRARGVPAGEGWFTQRQLSGGGALVDLGWHLLDTVVPLLGTASLAQVVATMSDDFIGDAAAAAAWRLDGPQPADIGDVEDTLRGFLVTENGVSVAVRASWASHEPCDLTVIRVEGSGGIATLRCTFGFSPDREGPSRLTVTRRGEPRQVPLVDEPIGSEYDRQLAELPQLLATPDVRGRALVEARGTITLIDRLYHSARESSRRTPAEIGAWKGNP